MKAGLVYRVSHFVWKDAGAQARHKLLHTVLLAKKIDVVLPTNISIPQSCKPSSNASRGTCIMTFCLKKPTLSPEFAYRPPTLAVVFGLSWGS